MSQYGPGGLSRYRHRLARGQSHVVGVVLLLGITVVALGGLTAVVGSVVDGQTASADETRVADAMSTQFRPLEQTGQNSGVVRFSEGRLTAVDRELRILTAAGVQRTVAVDGLVYTNGGRRAAFVAGSVVRGNPGNAWFERDPPVTVTRDDSGILVGAAKVGASGESVAGSGGVTVHLQTNVSHHQSILGDNAYAVAIETETPGPFVRYFERLGARTRTNDFDGDGVESVVASFDGRRTAYLVVHDMRTEVSHG